jgi:hypothetical protein
MKVRFFITDEDPEVVEIPLMEVAEFLRLLKSISLDKDGTYYDIGEVSYDVNQHALDVACTEAG